MINLKKYDPVADAVKNILQQEEKKRLILEPELDETGFHKAAHAAKKANQSHFEFQGKKYPVTAKSHAEAIQQEEGDCVTKPEAKTIAKKEVKVHEKSMHHKEEIDVNDRTKDMIGGRVKTKQKDDVGPNGDSKSTKVRFHAGPKNEAYAAEDEKKLADSNAAIVKTAKPIGIEDKHVKVKKLKEFQEAADEAIYDDLINEVMAKDASAGDYIHDFVHSKNPKFAGKSKAKRKEMALAAYYAKQRNEEYVDEGLKDIAKKVGKALTGGSDEDQRKDLQRKMGLPQTGKKPTHEEVVEEGWDDMVKDAKEKVASGPKPSGGSGKKEGSRYGGSKQKEKPEHDDVKEGRRPDSDSVPFVTDEAKPMVHAKDLAKKSFKRMKSEMLGKISN